MNTNGTDSVLNEAAPALSTPSPSSPPTPRRRRWPWVLGLAIAALAACLVLPRLTNAASKASGKNARGAQTRAVPVSTATARTGDLGVYLTGLGTVTPLNAVTVRSRVDGQLMKVAFREGQLVHAGDLLAQIDPRPFQVELLQADAQKAKDEAALKNARLDLERYRVLIQQDSIPRQQLDTQAATVDQAEASIASDRAQIESAKLNLVYSRITSPITGRVGLRLVDPGNIVHATDANGLVVITQLQPITVLFTIPSDQLAQVVEQVRAGARLTVEAWDRDQTTKLATGTLAAVDNEIDPTTGTLRLKAAFSNDNEALFPNQFVNARVLVNTLRGTVLVPTAAIQRGSQATQATFVYVVKPDATVEIRPVDVQLTEGDDTAIRKGLSAGETVVTDGIDKLEPGTKVAVAGAGNRPQAATASPRRSTK